MTKSDHQFEFLKDVCIYLIPFAIEKGFKITGGWLERNKEIQKMLFDAGLSDTLNSYHMHKCAIDLNFFKQMRDLTYRYEDLKEIGKYWEGLNKLNRWGGNIILKNGGRDTNHFERRIQI